MTASLRKRPILTGKDAERFLQRSQYNEKFMREYAKKKIKEYEDKIEKRED